MKAFDGVSVRASDPVSNAAAVPALSVARALGRALANLVHPRMLALVVWPMVAALALWLILAWLFGSQAIGAVQGWLAGSESLMKWTAWTRQPPWSTLALAFGWLLGFLLLIPLVLITATIIIGVVSMPVIVRFVAERNFPQLEPRRGGSVAGSIVNVLIALAVLVLLAFVSLPLWLIPALWPVLPVVLFAYFNQRLFRYDALAEHASTDELRRLIEGERSSLWLLGLALALIGHIPLVGLIMPVLGGLAFTHLLLDRLVRARASTVVTSVINSTAV